jgi:UDP-glucose-4-epimerase
MQDRHCVVTGGAGYIGSHLCKALAADGCVPVTVDNLFRGHRDFVRWGPLEEGDIRDGAFLDRVFARYRPVAVFHFAGLTYVGESVEQPDAYYDVNFTGAKSVLDAMRRGACDTIVFSSTAATYGIPRSERIDEGHPQLPINPYGWSKYFVERMLDDYAVAYGMKYAALRYFNACGADPGGEIGERHEPETHLIPLVLQTALGMRKAIKIFGTDYPTPDGTAIRDYVHVSDLADAHLLAMRHLMRTGENLALNLGTGKGYSVQEIVDAAERTVGGNIPVQEAPRRVGDPPVLVASNDRAREILGWSPRRNDLTTILRDAWTWHRRDQSL